MGSWMVTSFVPSGNVGSTWIMSTIDGTPSITSSVESNCEASDLISATDQPSRARSNAQSEMYATDSG